MLLNIYIVKRMLEVSYSLSIFSQMIRRCWDRNDIKGAINALLRMSDHAVSNLCLSHKCYVFKSVFDSPDS